MSLEALVINIKDNVATALRHLENGQIVSINTGADNTEIVLTQIIPAGHKFALRDIGPGEKVIKYGEIIGQAVTGISIGEHIHIHNVEGLRGRGDRQ